MTQDGFFHQRITRTDGDAVSTRNAARLSNGRAAIPQHAGVRIFPVDGKRFVPLDVLTSLYAAGAENALIGIVAIERIRVINLVGLRSKRDLLMLNGQQPCRVVDSAIAIVVVTDRAVEKMVAEDAIKGFHLGGRGLRPLSGDL